MVGFLQFSSNCVPERSLINVKDDQAFVKLVVWHKVIQNFWVLDGCV